VRFWASRVITNPSLKSTQMLASRKGCKFFALGLTNLSQFERHCGDRDQQLRGLGPPNEQGFGLREQSQIHPCDAQLLASRKGLKSCALGLTILFQFKRPSFSNKAKPQGTISSAGSCLVLRKFLNCAAVLSRMLMPPHFLWDS